MLQQRTSIKFLPYHLLRLGLGKMNMHRKFSLARNLRRSNQKLLGAALYRRRPRTTGGQLPGIMKSVDEFRAVVQPSLSSFGFALTHASDLIVQIRGGISQRNSLFVILVRERQRDNMTQP